MINIPNDYPSIQEGIENAIDRDIILVQQGNYTEIIDFMNKDVIMGSMSLMTGNTNYIINTIIDGNNSRRVVTIQYKESEIIQPLKAVEFSHTIRVL